MTTQESKSQGGAGGKPGERKPAVTEPGTPYPKQAGTSRAPQPGAKEPASQRQQGPRGEHGEGNYKATRAYNDGLKHHLQTHDVEKEARDAAPTSREEADDMERAVEEGRSRARGDDPEVNNA